MPGTFQCYPAGLVYHLGSHRLLEGIIISETDETAMLTEMILRTVPLVIEEVEKAAQPLVVALFVV